jgi:hypothetical protein
MTFWKYLEDFPPPLVRILARRSQGRINTVPLTDEEIAIGGQFPLERVREIMFSTSWEAIPFGEVKRFLVGCSFDPTDYQHRHRATAYARGGKYKYWTKSPMYQSHFVPLFRKLKEIYVRP